MTDLLHEAQCAYLDAFATYQSSLERLQALLSGVEQIAALLKDWRKVRIENVAVPGASSRPGASQALDARHWPSAEQVARALVQWHEAMLALNAAWQALPSGSRVGLVPPPE